MWTLPQPQELQAVAGLPSTRSQSVVLFCFVVNSWKFGKARFLGRGETNLLRKNGWEGNWLTHLFASSCWWCWFCDYFFMPSGCEIWDNTGSMTGWWTTRPQSAITPRLGIFVRSCAISGSSKQQDNWGLCRLVWNYHKWSDYIRLMRSLMALETQNNFVDASILKLS